MVPHMASKYERDEEKYNLRARMSYFFFFFFLSYSIAERDKNDEYV